MTLEQEMNRFWQAYHSEQRRWAETEWPAYQRAMRDEDSEFAQRLVCDLFSGSRRSQLARFKRMGIYSNAFFYAGKKQFLVPLGKPNEARKQLTPIQ